MQIITGEATETLRLLPACVSFQSGSGRHR